MWPSCYHSNAAGETYFTDSSRNQNPLAESG